MRLFVLLGVVAFPAAVSAGPIAAKHVSETHSSATISSPDLHIEKVWVAKDDLSEISAVGAQHASEPQEKHETVWVAKTDTAVDAPQSHSVSKDPVPSVSAATAHQVSSSATQLDLAALPPAASAWVSQEAVASGISQPASAPLVSGSMAAFRLPMGVEPSTNEPHTQQKVWVAENVERAEPALPDRQLSGQKHRSRNPIGRIATDSVEAVADLLPWVDRERKDEPIEEVLARVADELARARAADPEWVLPAEQELRALAKRIGSLPAPPVGQATEQGSPLPVPPSRSYALRPLWPGADGSPEVRRRPVSPTTESGFEMAPSSTADSVGPYVDPDAPPPKTVSEAKTRPSATPTKSAGHSAARH